jgi:hypothetical protein
LDGGHLSYSKNFPSSYAPPQCLGCWVRTYPGYKPALLPYWGKNKLLLSTNGQQCDTISFIPYSTNGNSSFCSEAKEISDLYLNLTNEHETIAEYWDDGPGISGTPPGHLFQLALDLSESKKIDLRNFVELFASLGIALNDAFIETWRLKYEYNIIRPISYIQEYIRKDFNTLLETPSFPEFPSGHSFQAGAGTEILIHYFSDQQEIVDSTNVLRKDINGSARTFTNFSTLAEEMSISRFYGGIHYKKTLEISLNYGQLIGRNSIKNLNFH